MTVSLLSFAQISSKGLNQVWHDGGGSMAAKFTRWVELGAGAADKTGLPPLKGRYFSMEPSPRFGRMDDLCKLALGAAELCMAHAPGLTRQDVALVGGSMLGCHEVDALYHDTLLKGGSAAASPGLFVYTLPSMFLGEIAIKFGIRGRTSYINAGKQSAVAALCNGIRLIEKSRESAVLVVAAEAAGPAVRQLDIDTAGRSGACAWLLSGNRPGFREFGRVRFGVARGEPLEAGEDGFGLTYVAALDNRQMYEGGTFCCGEGANAISLDLLRHAV